MKPLLILLAAVVGCLPLARAEQPYLLTDVVVTPTGSEKDAFDTSLPVNALDARDLVERATISIPDLFRGIPGVDAVTAGPGSVQPVIRGLFGERVLVLVNGIRLSEQRPGGNHVFSLDPAQVERVEIVRGPASVLYGSDAIGGVINFITKGADDETGPGVRFGGEADVQAQSNGEGGRASAHVRSGRGDVNTYAGGVYRDLDNLETPDGEVANSFYEGFTLWGGGTVRRDRWWAGLDYSFMQADIGIPGPPVFAEDFFDDEIHHRLALRLESDPASARVERLSLDAGWQRHERNRVRRKIADNPPVVRGDLLINIELDIDTFTAKPQVVYVPNDTHRVTAGIDAFYEDATSDRTLRDTASSWVNPRFDGVPVIPDSTRVGVGAFVQDEIALGYRWAVTPGLRVDWIRAESDGNPRHAISEEVTSENSAVSGNLGVLYKASNQVNLYGNLGRAFRAPTLLELYFFGPHDVGNDIGNPDLDAETSWNLDAGIKTRSDRLQTMVSAFYNRIDDYIVEERQANGDDEFKNIDQVNLYGAEAGADVRLGGGFSAYANLSFVRGEDDDSGEDLPGIPPLKARYGVRYDADLGGGRSGWFEVGGLTAAEQDRVAPNERETDGFSRADLRLGVDVGETWSLVAAVENVTDELYQDHLSAVWQSFGINDQPGRNVKLLLSARF